MQKWSVAACVLATGCLQSEALFVNDGVVAFALTEDTPPLVETDEAALYLVEHRVELPVRDPGESVMAARREGASAYEGLPFDRLPWVGRDDLAIEIDYTIARMDAPGDDGEGDPVNVTVTANGINEFHEYLPGFTIDDDELLIDFAQWERTHLLEPLEREHWTIREEELDEVAVDLATVVNGAPNSNQVVYFENHSSSDTRSRMFIPAVVPGLIGVRIGIRAEAAVNVVLEASVRVREVEERLIEDDDDPLEVTPELFRPVIPMEEE